MQSIKEKKDIEKKKKKKVVKKMKKKKKEGLKLDCGELKRMTRMEAGLD